MSDSPRDTRAAALSFDRVAEAYDRARPSYPREAAAWLAGTVPCDVLELGAGTGKLTEELVGLGHHVLATDPLATMLHRLRARVPGVATARSCAERIPARSRSFDRVVAGQAFHWFDAERALPEIARVLRPGGEIALVWNLRDERVPWVRRLGAMIGTPEQQNAPTHALLASNLFGYVDTANFRLWQRLDRRRLHDLVVSRSNVALMTQTERERLLRKVDDLYDDYGRGPDGMLLPYVTHCYRAVVRAPAEEESPENPAPVESDGTGTDALLIDFS
jgi:SAM-dependent methyltransferase